MTESNDPIDAAEALLVLGMKPSSGEDTMEVRARNAVASHFARNIKGLRAFAQENPVTLSSLASARLLPVRLANNLLNLDPEKLPYLRDAAVKLLNTDLDTLDRRDIAQYMRFPHVGASVVLQLEAVKEVYDATCGFQFLPASPPSILSVEEQEALLEIIRQRMRNDPVIQSRLAQILL